MSNKILIIGSGGREHALAWKLKQSPRVGKIYIAPGNAGTAQLGENVDIKATDVTALVKFADEHKIYFTIVGPDDALALGIVDEFQKRGLKIWGPNKLAAQIEASKAFAKELMQKNNIPTAEFKTFTDYEKALKYVQEHFKRSAPIYGLQPINRHATLPIVIKASGLALGKGVSVCKTTDEAKKFLKEVMVDKIFGDAGNEVVIEEFLQGQEFSIHAFSDGETFKLLPSSQDHKPIFDGGLGPNTGGMGTIAPVPWVSKAIMDEVSSKIVKPALEGLKNLGCPFVGLLYPGLMAVSPPFQGGVDREARRGGWSPSAFAEASADDPLNNKSKWVKVIEFNARFGDPETQSYMRLLKTDLLDILEACVKGKIADIKIEWSKKYACCVILASDGYPGKYEKGKIITGIKEAEKMEDVVVFHAGTAPCSLPPLAEGGLLVRQSFSDGGGGVITNGGRVLGVTAIADDLQSALDKAYAAVKLIHFDGMHYRKDIGAKSLTIPASS
jgi:phosphoribosylamine--glycine ligase